MPARTRPVIGQPVTFHPPYFHAEGATRTGDVVGISEDLFFIDCGENDDPQWAQSGGREGYGVPLDKIVRCHRVSKASAERAANARKVRGFPNEELGIA